jgi:hypothetical protein
MTTDLSLKEMVSTAIEQAHMETELGRITYKPGDVIVDADDQRAVADGFLFVMRELRVIDELLVALAGEIDNLRAASAPGDDL